MERIPEPELMDDEEQARAYSEADFAEPHQRFVALCQERLGPSLEGTVLDLGCGPADVTVRFAHAYPRCRIHGVDGSEAMLRFGRARVEREGLSGRVELFRAYLPDEAPPLEAYDAVLSNSLLHHLKEPMALWDTVRAFAKPGAPVFVMDLMRPESRAEAARFVELYAKGEPDVLRKDFFHSLLAAYRTDEVEAQLARAGLESLTVEAVTDRHLIVHGRTPR